MKKKIVFTLSLLVIFSIASSKLYSQPDDFAPRGLNRLNLTDAQKEDFAKLRSAHQKQMIELTSDLKKMHIDMRDEWMKDNPDQKKIQALQDKISDQKAKIAKSRTDHWFQLYGKLNDTQKKDFKKMSGNLMMKKRDKMLKKERFDGRGPNMKGLRRGMINCPNPDCPFKDIPPQAP